MNAAMLAVALAENGVVWKKGKGAICPVCRKRMHVGSKQGNVRYCYCRRPSCVICAMKIGVKALEE